MHRIKLTQIAALYIKEVNSRTRIQILNKIESLKEEPLLLGKPLQGPLRHYRSIRAAGQRYRIIYKVEKDEVIVVIVAIGIRREGDESDIYELMKKYIKIGLLK